MGPLLIPFLLRFSCEDIYTYDTKLPGGILFAGAAEWVEPLAQRDFNETYSTKGLNKLSLRESTCNSASP